MCEIWGYPRSYVCIHVVQCADLPWAMYIFDTSNHFSCPLHGRCVQHGQDISMLCILYGAWHHELTSFRFHDAVHKRFNQQHLSWDRSVRTHVISFQRRGDASAPSKGRGPMEGTIMLNLWMMQYIAEWFASWDANPKIDMHTIWWQMAVQFSTSRVANMYEFNSSPTNEWILKSSVFTYWPSWFLRNVVWDRISLLTFLLRYSLLGVVYHPSGVYMFGACSKDDMGYFLSTPAYYSDKPSMVHDRRRWYANRKGICQSRLQKI